MKNLFILLTLSLTLGTAAAAVFSIECCSQSVARSGEPCPCGDWE